MKGTRIRWSEHTWNAMVGCSKISPGCDHCYAETITVKFGLRSFPNGFDPTFKPKKLTEPGKFLRSTGPSRVFVNSMSDVHHEDFTVEQIDSVYDAMFAVPEHDYLVLTKRPQRMAAYFLGSGPVEGYLARRGLDQMPANIWLGTSIESDRYTFRARHLATIPAVVHFLSLEPLLGPLPSLDLFDIQWAIVGGESGPGYRPMDHQWARDIRDRCKGNDEDPQLAFYFKQSAAPRTETGMELDGVLIEEYPLEHPADRIAHGNPARVGRWTGRHSTPTATVTVSKAKAKPAAQAGML